MGQFSGQYLAISPISLYNMKTPPSRLFRTTLHWDLLVLVSVLLTLISGTLSDVVLSVMALYAAIRCFKSRGQIEVLKQGLIPLTLIATWLLCNIIGYITASPMGPEQLDEIFGLRWIIVFFVCIYAGTQINRLDNRKIQQSSIAFSALLILGLIWQFYHPLGINLYGGIERLRGFYANPNVFALALIIPWSFLVGYFSLTFSDEHRLTWPAILTLAVTTLTLYATFTRSVWIGMAAVSLVVMATIRNKKIIATVGAIISSLAVMFVFNIFSFKDRLLTAFEVSKGNSSAIRLQIWNINWHIFLDHPFFGVGFHENMRMAPEYYKRIYPGDEPFVSHAHNQYLQVLSTSGILGFIAYCLIFALGLHYFYQKFKTTKNDSTRKVAYSGFLILIAYLFSGFTECPLMLHEPRVFLLLFTGLCIGYTLK